MCAYVIALCTLCYFLIFKFNIGISSYFLYFHWYLKEDVTPVKFGTVLKQQFNELINGSSQRNKH